MVLPQRYDHASSMHFFFTLPVHQCFPTHIKLHKSTSLGSEGWKKTAVHALNALRGRVKVMVIQT